MVKSRGLMCSSQELHSIVQQASPSWLARFPLRYAPLVGGSGPLVRRESEIALRQFKKSSAFLAVGKSIGERSLSQATDALEPCASDLDVAKPRPIQARVRDLVNDDTGDVSWARRVVQYKVAIENDRLEVASPHSQGCRQGRDHHAASEVQNVREARRAKLRDLIARRAQFGKGTLFDRFVEDARCQLNAAILMAWRKTRLVDSPMPRAFRLVSCGAQSSLTFAPRSSM